MIYETALIWVLISAGYWGVFLLRRGVYATATFPFMMIAAAALSGLGLLGSGEESRFFSLAGAVGLGAGICLLMLGPLARRFARRANSAERWLLARGLYEVAEVLQPGTGVRDEKRLASAFAEIHAGRVEDAVKALLLVRDRAPAQAQRAFDEHITMIYMTAWQWQQAITHAESTLLRARDAGGDPALERNLLIHSISAPLWVELIGAYGRVGELSRAASMLSAFEISVGEEPRAAPLLHRARLVFLALCGQVAAVRALAAPAQSPHMTKAARRYWIGVAADRAGDRELAATELRAAVSVSRGRARRLAESALADAERATKVELPADVAAVAQQTIEQPAIVWETSPRPWLTWLLCGSCAAVAVALGATGSSTDVATLVRAGATVRGLVADGQWWRLATNVLLHVGALHVAVNVISLWVIGRLSEEVFGKLRTAALFAICGVAGAASSYFAARAGVSAGASGAIFGLLGASFAELTRHRRHFAVAIRNGMWGALLVVAIATLAVGSQVPEIDQWAHVGGLVAGVVFGQLLSPRHRLGRFTVIPASLAILGFVAMLGWGARDIARTDFATLMIGGPRITVAFGSPSESLVAEVPHRWQLIDGELADPDIFAVLTARVGAVPATPIAGAAPDAAAALLSWFDGEAARARELQFATVRVAARPLLSVPPPWQVREHELTVPSQFGGDQHYRVISFGRVDGQLLIVGSLYAPQSLVDAAPAALADIIASLRLRQTTL